MWTVFFVRATRPKRVSGPQTRFWRQCSSYCCGTPSDESELSTLMRRMDELHLEFPFAGARMLQGLLAAEGSKVGRRIDNPAVAPVAAREPAVESRTACAAPRAG